MSQIPAWITHAFQTIDAMDAVAFAALIAEDGSFVMGNAPPVVGRKAIVEIVGGFFGAIAGLSHSLDTAWVGSDSVSVNGVVTYTRHDGSTVALPFCDVFRMKGAVVQDWLIYMDVNPLFAPPA